MFSQDTYDRGDAIAISWHIDDVKSLDDSLTDEQAREVLQNFSEHHDGSMESLWQDLQQNIDWYQERLKHIDETIKSAEDARQFAIEWQADASEENYDTLDLIEWHEKFEYLGKKYNLTEEFKENGII